MGTILVLIQTLSGLSGLINSIRSTLEVKKKNGEMTPEEEKAYDDYVAAEMQQPWWKKSSEAPPVQPPVET